MKISIGDICRQHFYNSSGHDVTSIIVVTEMIGEQLVRGYEIDSTGEHFNGVCEGCFFADYLEVLQ
jgi:hypothetical protein